jgi:hypothetical protein
VGCSAKITVYKKKMKIWMLSLKNKCTLCLRGSGWSVICIAHSDLFACYSIRSLLMNLFFSLDSWVWRNLKELLQRYDKYIEEGRFIESMVSLTKDSKVFKVNLIPDFNWYQFSNLFLWINARTVKAGMFTSELVPTMYYEFRSSKKLKEHLKTTKKYLQKFYCSAAARVNPY